MMVVFSLILCLTFLLLAFIHFNWALGGQWGFDNALPSKENGERFIDPKKIDSAIVGMGLFAFSIFYLITSDIIKMEIPHWIRIYVGWMIPAIFMLRAMGDFKYIGFFKKITLTKFAELDTKYYSPLCLIVGIIGISLQLLK